MLKYLALLLLGLVLVIVVAIWWRNRLKLKKIINTIPGPKGNPLVGCALDFLNSPENIWRFFRRWATEYYPIYKLWPTVTPVVCILSPEDMEIVLSSTKHSAKSDIYYALHPWLNTGLLTSKESKWQSRRKILTPAFHFNILQQFVPVFAEESELLVERLKQECQKQYTDVVPVITRFTLNSICETAMGTRLSRGDTKSEHYIKAILRMEELICKRITRPWLHPDLIFWLSSTYQEQKKNLSIVHTFTKSVIEHRKLNFKEPEALENNDFTKRKRLALLDLLISAKNSGQPIDEEGIREEVDTFMFEGHDTTTACISFTLMLLACHPKIQDKVVEELQVVFGCLFGIPTIPDLQNLRYLERVIKESLRMYPSVPMVSRVTDEEFRTYAGYVIPANTILLLQIYDLHHNPELYPQPEKFDPDRFLPENVQKRHPFAYVPFSAGPRNCIGQKFAMLEVKMAIAAILRRFVLEPIDLPSDITISINLILKTKNGIKIKFRKRLNEVK